MKMKYFGARLRLAAVLLCALVGPMQPVMSQDASCLTPTFAKGLCVSYKRCTFVIQQIEKYGQALPPVFRDFLRNSRCEGNTPDIHICCDVTFVEPSSNIASTTVRPSISTTFNFRPSTSSSFSSPNKGVASPITNENMNRGMQILLNTKCGNSSDDKVAFGELTTLGEYPWMALIRYNSQEQPFKCGGTLITNRYVLTAAHCMIGIKDIIIGVRLGEYDIDSEEDCQRKGRKMVCAPKIEEYGIAKRIPHPEYSPSQRTNDVLLLKLDRVVNFNWHITPICLPITEVSKKFSDDQSFIIAGWGTTELGTTSNILVKAVVPYQDRQVCQNIYKRERITENHICAGGEGRIDSCKGDSGGPLFFKARYQRTPRYVQYGIVSFGGVSCGRADATPGIYSNIIHNLPWITSNID